MTADRSTSITEIANLTPEDHKAIIDSIWPSVERLIYYSEHNRKDQQWAAEHWGLLPPFIFEEAVDWIIKDHQRLKEYEWIIRGGAV